MAGSIAYGTSRRARLAGITVGGKTGTAQVASSDRVAEEDADRPEHLRNHAWFIAVAPIDDPGDRPRGLRGTRRLRRGGGIAHRRPTVMAEYFGAEVAYREIVVPVTTETTGGEGAAQR